MSLTERPLVSIITGTWQRHQLLLEMIENVRLQTYKPVEMVVVSDGPDPDLAVLLKAYRHSLSWNDRPHIRQFELGFWSSGLLSNSTSAAPFMVAQLLARGEYHMWWADDERALVPDHIEKLVDLLEETGADFVYPQVELTWPYSGRRLVVGSDPPQSGQFTHCLYRREALDKGLLFRTHVGHMTDWDACSRAMSAGAKSAFLPELTFTHRVDK